MSGQAGGRCMVGAGGWMAGWLAGTAPPVACVLPLPAPRLPSLPAGMATQPAGW